MLLVDYGSNEFFPPHCFMITRDLVSCKNPWDEGLKINQDGVFFCQILIMSSSVFFVRDTYVSYRVPGFGNISSLNNLEKASDLIRSWRNIEGYIDKAGFKAIDYIKEAKGQTFVLLKENKFRSLIIKNFWYFRSQLYGIIETYSRLKSYN